MKNKIVDAFYDYMSECIEVEYEDGTIERIDYTPEGGGMDDECKKLISGELEPWWDESDLVRRP